MGDWYKFFNGICMRYTILLFIVFPIIGYAQIQKNRETEPVYGVKFITFKLKGKGGDLLPITLTQYKNEEKGSGLEFSFVQEINLPQYLQANSVTSLEIFLKDGSVIPLDDEQLKSTQLQASYTGNGYKATVTSLLTKDLLNLLHKAWGIRVNQYGDGVRFFSDPNGQDAKDFLSLVKFFKL